MATMREVDTAMWLHNKLSSDDMWSGTNIWSMLNTDVLRNIQDCFHTLDSHVKIKLLMSFLYIPRRNAQEMSSELNDILEIGSSDSDDWVRILSEILRNYPETGSLNVDLESVSPVFAAIVHDIRQVMNDGKDRRSLLPMESPYLNRGALHATIGAQPAPAKHFTLRRKPKSAALKAELFQKATDSSSGLKRSHSLIAGSSNAGGLKRSDSTGKSPAKQNVPLARVHSKTAPSTGTSALRGLSAASLKQQNRTAKLLDINEQPIGGGVREAKRRKKLITAEMENLLEEDRKKKELSKSQESSTPEYAIGLTTPVETTTQPAASTAPTSTTTPSYASMAGLNARPHHLSSTKPDSTSQDNSLTASSANFSQELQMHIDRERENMKMRHGTTGQQANTGHHSSATFKSVSLQPPSQPSHPARHPTLPSQPASSNPTPKRDLKLTREQMLAAQEMFRDANKVTKPEKALILGFMAGARENPFPDQGPVITVKLSEHTEISTAPSMNSPQTQLVEMLFEMNYDTGHWRRLKRTRIVARQQPVEQSTQ